MRKIVVGLALASLLTGCADEPTSGYITQRVYHPGYYYMTMQCMAYDAKTGACTMNIPVQHYVPDSFELCMKDDTTKKDGCRTVASDEYERYQVGQHYPDAQ